ncbi:hypothetical protein [Arthrobacter oryzae]|uniref:hypothetical protein n=1 Tax=Arthrobacter oryzae TaxID=409290 RepID=UPI00285A11C4|nr:hypothetical protein [Arthrobacter oryzae]MDR6508195.1 hypothetical protein [Arthrobacter oryzae]
MSKNEVDLLKWPDPLPSSWRVVETEAPQGWEKSYSVTNNNLPAGAVHMSFVLSTPLATAYPAGVRDRLLEPAQGASAEALQLVSEKVMKDDPACRRLVLATTEGDVEAIARGEAAGYRYVVDVDVPGRSLSLLVAEPDWVLEESRHLDDIPTE